MAVQRPTNLERSNCSWRDTKHNWRDTKCPCPQGGDTKLIVSLSEGPKQFKVPLSQYKSCISYVLMHVYIDYRNNTPPRL